MMVGLATGRQRTAPSRLRGFSLKRVGSHMIYFQETDTALVVVRILHGHMDAERHLPEETE